MKKIQLTFIGLRITQDDKVMQAFLHGKERLYFTGIKFLSIGRKYEAVSKGKGEISMLKNPPVIDCDPVNITSEWRDANSAAIQFMKRKREALKGKREADEMWPALKPLHERCLKLNAWERRSFAEYVARLIVSGVKK